MNELLDAAAEPAPANVHGCTRWLHCAIIRSASELAQGSLFTGHFCAAVEGRLVTPERQLWATNCELTVHQIVAVTFQTKSDATKQPEVRYLSRLGSGELGRAFFPALLLIPTSSLTVSEAGDRNCLPQYLNLVR